MTGRALQEIERIHAGHVAYMDERSGQHLAAKIARISYEVFEEMIRVGC